MKSRNNIINIVKDGPYDEVEEKAAGAVRFYQERGGCFMMSRNPPPLLLAAGGVRMISSGSTPLPFFLLASERICLASSILDLAMSHLGDSGSQKRMTEPTATMAEMRRRCQCQSRSQ